MKILSNGDGLYPNWQARQLLGQPSHICYFFDPETRKAAIKPADADDSNSYPLRGKGNISARRFVGHYSIQPGRLCPAWSEDGMLVFDVGEAAET